MDVVPDHGGEEGAELKDKGPNLPVSLLSSPHLWSQAVGGDRKNNIANASGQKEFPV